MRTVLSPGSKAVGSISKVCIRRHASLGNLYEWEVEKQCRSNLNQKGQSTVALCAGTLLVLMLLLFLLCTIDVSRVPGQPAHSSAVAQLGVHVAKRGRIQRSTEIVSQSEENWNKRSRAALHGLGTVYRRGRKAMNELIVAHVSERTSLEGFRMFLRTIHRSGAMAKADLVLLFPRSPPSPSMIHIIGEEDASFQKLLLNKLNIDSSEPTAIFPPAPQSMPKMNFPHLSSNATINPFNWNAFTKAAEESNSSVQPVWGSRHDKISEKKRSHSLEIVWGSIVGFEAAELNPDDALRGFIDKAPLQLRRWACYQMLLGMVRHKFKHILLTEVSGVMVLRDPFATARKKGGLYLSLEDRSWGAVTTNGMKLGRTRSAGRTAMAAGQVGDMNKELPVLNGDRNDGLGSSNRLGSRQVGLRKVGRKRRGKASTGICERVYGRKIWSSLEEVEKKKKLVNSGAILGGIHQMRGLANAMVIEIVKVALERKDRNPFPDNVLLSYLLHKSSVLGKRVLEHLHVTENGDSYVHSLVGSNQATLFFKKGRQAYSMLHGYNKCRRWLSVVAAVHNDICSSPADAKAYRNCH